jgi:hypothetical protein
MLTNCIKDHGWMKSELRFRAGDDASEGLSFRRAIRASLSPRLHH